MPPTKTPSDTNIICTGLKVDTEIPQYFRDLYGSAADIEAKIDADIVLIREAGYNVTIKYMDDADPQAGLEWLSNKLREDRVDGIMIGSGLRYLPAQTGLFEDVVDVCRREAPGSLFMFNDGPGTNFVTLMRNLGRLGLA
ncbi:hypothetical protein P280DRAFT_470867 [Massarina eburnea CBS 473.64]|uniref:Uncharacterized protein n=1 Tax=Massarina eburnea CBS 473.64 TaxID=1395130 RepID=A0A6A6RVT5_9PLEO|nr:hypothetical protein P280DRAFT_470867 [Massarina eburnea CBS 473.64]